MKTFLHVGCGPQNKSRLRGFSSPDWQEIRFDIDPNVKPDIEGSLTDMSLVKDSSVDAIYSSHNIEHLYPHEVPVAVREFHRVLKRGGYVVLTCPDLQSVCEAIVADQLTVPLYQSPAGPISPIDILYGHRGFIQQGNEYMAHKSGFTYTTLTKEFSDAGFRTLAGMRRPTAYDLWVVAFKDATTQSEALQISGSYLPTPTKGTTPLI